MGNKQQLIYCRSCGCELSFRELQDRQCFVCVRNNADRAAARGEKND